MKVFKTYESFAKFVGLLDENTDWGKLGIQPDEGMDFSTSRLAELIDFTNKNPKYHIVTYTSDGDDSDTVTFDNKVRIVNRLAYCLAKGSKRDAFLSEKRWG